MSKNEIINELKEVVSRLAEFDPYCFRGVSESQYKRYKKEVLNNYLSELKETLKFLLLAKSNGKQIYQRHELRRKMLGNKIDRFLQGGKLRENVGIGSVVLRPVRIEDFNIYDVFV